MLNILKKQPHKSGIFGIIFSNQALLTQRLISRRWLSAVVESPKSIDYLPGHYDFIQEEQISLWTDTINFFEEKYKIAKQFDQNSPMFKMNFFGTPSVVLFSHDLVRQCQEYELRGQTHRTLGPFDRLFGEFAIDMYGRTHMNWRKNATSEFKPEIVDQYTPFIQKCANDIMLSRIADITQKTGKSTYFCGLSKRFAYEIGIKFTYGPLLNPQERNDIFEVQFLIIICFAH